MAKLVVFKIGDQPTVNGYRDGDPVTILDTGNGAPKPSKHMLRVFAIVKVPDAVAKRIQEECLLPENADKKVPTLKRTTLAKLAARTLDPTIESKWRDPKQVVDVVDATVDVGADFLPSLYKLPTVQDINAVTSGQYTVGSGGSYADWASAASDTGNLTGDLTFVQVSDFNASSNAAFGANLNGYTLKLTSSKRHCGNPNAGWITYTTFATSQRTIQFGPATITGGGTFEVEHLNLKRTANNNDPSRGPFFIDTGQTCIIKIHDIMADWEASSGQYNCGRFMRMNCAAATWYLWNIVATNFKPRSTDNSGGETFFLLNGTASSVIENCSVSTTKIPYTLNTKAYTVRNCCGRDAKNNTGTASVVFDAMSAATGRNNAADDATCADANWAAGSGNLINQNFALQFVSLDRTNNDFFKLLDTATFRYLGNTPTNTFANPTGGAWEVLTPDFVATTYNYKLVATSSDGSYVLAGWSTGVGAGKLYLSKDKGVNWAEVQPGGAVSLQWICGAMSHDGQVMLVGVLGQRLYLSIDGGTSWAETQPAGAADKNWRCVSVSPDGNTLLAAVTGGRLYLSTNKGVSWSEVQPEGNLDRSWISVATSNLGAALLATNTSTKALWLSTDGGAIWTDIKPGGSSEYLFMCAISNDGQSVVTGEFVAPNGRFFYSSNQGGAWSTYAGDYVGGLTWYWGAVNSDGSRKLIGSSYAVYQYRSGAWSEINPPARIASVSESGLGGDESEDGHCRFSGNSGVGMQMKHWRDQGNVGNVKGSRLLQRPSGGGFTSIGADQNNATYSPPPSGKSFMVINF